MSKYSRYYTVIIFSAMWMFCKMNIFLLPFMIIVSVGRWVDGLMVGGQSVGGW